VRTPDLLTAFQYLIQFAMRGRRNTNARVQNNEEIKRTLNKHVASSRVCSALNQHWVTTGMMYHALKDCSYAYWLARVFTSLLRAIRRKHTSMLIWSE